MEVTKGLCQLSLSSDGDEENCDFDQVPCPGAWPSSPQLPPEPFVLAASWYDPIEPDPSKPSDSEHALKLMQLPQEIRDVIFEYAFGITNIVENPILTKSSKLEPLPLARRYYRHELEGRGFLACLLTVKLMPSVNLGSIIVSKQFFHDALAICHPRNGIGMFISENLDFAIHNSLPSRPSFLEFTLTSLLTNTRSLWLPQKCEYALTAIVLKRIFNAAPQLQRLTIVDEVPWQWMRRSYLSRSYPRDGNTTQLLSQAEVYAMVNLHELPKDLRSILEETTFRTLNRVRPLISKFVLQGLNAARLCYQDNHRRGCRCASDLLTPRHKIQIYQQLTIDCDVKDMITDEDGDSEEIRKKMLVTFLFNIETYVKTRDLQEIKAEIGEE